MAKIMKSTIIIPSAPAMYWPYTSLSNTIYHQIYCCFSSHLFLHLLVIWFGLVFWICFMSYTSAYLDYKLVNCSNITLERDKYELFQNCSVYINAYNRTLNDTFYIESNNTTLKVCKAMSDAEKWSFALDIIFYEFPKPFEIGYILVSFLLCILLLFTCNKKIIPYGIPILLGISIYGFSISLPVFPALNSGCNLDILYRIPALKYFLAWTAITWISMLLAEVFMIGSKLLSKNVKYVSLKTFMITTSFVVMMQLMLTKFFLSHAAYLSLKVYGLEILPFKNDDLYLILGRQLPLFYWSQFASLIFINIGTHYVSNAVFEASICSKKIKEVRRQLRMNYVKLFAMSISIYIFFIVGYMWEVASLIFICVLLIILHMWWEMSNFFNMALITLHEVNFEMDTGFEIPEKNPFVKEVK